MEKSLECLTFEEGRKLLDKDGVASFQEYQAKSLKEKRESSLVVSGLKVDVGGHLGGGGTKEIYDVSISGKKYALAIPGSNKDSSVAQGLWERALREPENTKKLRSYGLAVNNLSEIVKAENGGVSFPVIIMGRYEDQDSDVYDSKNVHRNRNPLFNENTKFSEGDFLGMFGLIIKDIVILIHNGISLPADSINYCQDSTGRGRLYFSDLGDVKFNQSFGNVGKITESYVADAMDSVLASVSPRVYWKNKDLQTLGENKVWNKMKKKLVEDVESNFALAA